jgi:hypothetical protein
MGLFNFIKEAGAKLFGGEAKAASPEDLKKEVQSHGFDARDINIDVQGDKESMQTCGGDHAAAAVALWPSFAGRKPG